MDDLKRISDDWLAHHAGGEKTFSMGGFEPPTSPNSPAPWSTGRRRIAAFATIWTTAAAALSRWT